MFEICLLRNYPRQSSQKKRKKKSRPRSEQSHSKIFQKKKKILTLRLTGDRPASPKIAKSGEEEARVSTGISAREHAGTRWNFKFNQSSNCSAPNRIAGICFRTAKRANDRHLPLEATPLPLPPLSTRAIVIVLLLITLEL